MAIFSGKQLQAGHGFAGFFKGITALFKPLIRLFTGPVAKKSVDVLRKVAVKPIAKTFLKQSKKELGKMAANVVSDILQGENLQDSIKKNGKSALKNIGRASLQKALTSNKKLVSEIASKLPGPGKTKSQTSNKDLSTSKKKKRKRNIFEQS